MLVVIPIANIDMGIKLCAVTERKLKELSNLDIVSLNNIHKAVYFINLQ